MGRPPTPFFGGSSRPDRGRRSPFGPALPVRGRVTVRCRRGMAEVCAALSVVGGLFCVVWNGPAPGARRTWGCPSADDTHTSRCRVGVVGPGERQTPRTGKSRPRRVGNKDRLDLRIAGAITAAGRRPRWGTGRRVIGDGGAAIVTKGTHRPHADQNRSWIRLPRGPACPVSDVAGGVSERIAPSDTGVTGRCPCARRTWRSCRWH